MSKQGIVSNQDSDTADKDAIIAGLKASFAECDKAFAATTDANFTEMFTVGQGKRSRAGLMDGAAVTVVERSGSDWVRVRAANGQEGWVPARYLVPNS